jgi:hypothetical protein
LKITCLLLVPQVVEAWAAQQEAAQQQQGAGSAGAAARGWSGRAVMMPHTHAFGTGGCMCLLCLVLVWVSNNLQGNLCVGLWFVFGFGP